MKKVKIAIWVIIVGFVAILIYQNREFFVGTRQILSLNLLIDVYKTPELHIVYICFAFFGAGLLLGLYFLLLNHLRLKKSIKSLNATIKSQQDKLADLPSPQPIEPVKSVEASASDSAQEDKTVVLESQADTKTT